MIISNKFNGYSRDGRRTYHFDGGGGGGQESTTTSYQTNIPEYAKEPFMNLVGKAEALSQAPYQAYTGERTAQFTPLQQQAFQRAGAQTTAPQTGMATDLAATAGLGALGAGNYQAGQFYGGRFGAPQAAQYMSPFIEQALAPQIREAQRTAGIQGTQQQAQATQAGAFGGARDAIMRAERERNLGQQVGDITAKGYQTAYEQAANQFNQDQARRLEASKLGEQSRQFGANLGLQGLQTAGQMAGQLGTLGQQQFTQEQAITGQQAEYGAQQRQAVQDMLTQQYQDFQTQKNYPYQQLGFLADILRGTAGTTRTMYEPGPSAAQQLIGAGTAMYGASKMFAEGGEVGYADGGGIGDLYATANRMKYLPNPELQKKMQAAGNNDIKTFLAAKLVEQKRAELNKAVQNEQALGAPAQQPTIVEQELAADEAQGLAAIAPDSAGEFADGGLVSFADGGDTGLNAPWWSPEYVRAAEASGLSGLELEELRRQAARQALIRNDPVQSIAKYGVASTEQPVTQATYDDADRMAKRYPAPSTAQGVQPTAGTQPGVAGLKAPTGQPTGQGSGAGLRVSTSSRGPLGSGGVEDLLATRNKLFDPTKVEGELDTLAKQRTTAQEEAVQSQYDQAVSDFAKQSPLGAEAIQRATERLESLKGKEEKIQGAGLLKAGLAILASPGSKGLAGAIGAGGQAGLEEYQSGMEKLEAKRDALTDKLDQYAILNQQEQRAQGKELREIKAKKAGLKAEGIELMLENKKFGAQLREKTADVVFNGLVDLRKADIAANATMAAASMRGAGGGGTAELDRLKTLQSGLTTQLANYRNAFTPQDRQAKAQLEQQLQLVRAEIAQLAGLDTIGASAAPAGFTVTKLPAK